MKQISTLILVGAVIISTAWANDVLDVEGISGNIRLAYINQNDKVDQDTYATSIGGILKYDTADWNGFKLGVGAYVSQKISFATGLNNKTNPDLFDVNGDSFVYVGEAYVNYNSHDMNVCIGRQIIETPFVAADDVRMLPNTFEGVMATYSGFGNTLLTAGYLTRWAGFDSPRGHTDSINEFKKFGLNHDSNGVMLIGVTDQSINDVTLQGWMYSVDKVTDGVYVDGVYTFVFNDTSGIDFLSQFTYLHQDNTKDGLKTGIDGSVYGFGVDVRFDNGLTLNAAVNVVHNKEGTHVINGFGGGPYYTAMKEWTIAGLEDAKAYRFGGELDLSAVGVDGLKLLAGYGELNSAPSQTDVQEIDLIATYTMNKTSNIEVSYAMIDDKNKNTAFDESNIAYDGGYDRFLVRLNYNF